MLGKFHKSLVNLIGGALLAGWVLFAFAVFGLSNSPRADLTATYDKVSEKIDARRGEDKEQIVVFGSHLPR